MKRAGNGFRGRSFLPQQPWQRASRPPLSTALFGFRRLDASTTATAAGAAASAAARGTIRTLRSLSRRQRRLGLIFLSLVALAVLDAGALTRRAMRGSSGSGGDLDVGLVPEAERKLGDDGSAANIGPRYTNPSVLSGGCSVTVLFMEPSISDGAIWALESAAANVRAGEGGGEVCVLIQTSACPGGGGASDGAAGSVVNSFPNHPWPSALSDAARSLARRAPTHLRGLIDRGNVRVTGLNHTRYGLDGCGDFRPASNVWISHQYWSNAAVADRGVGINGEGEFMSVDSDLVLIIQSDSVLCHPFHVDAWRKYAFVGAPWHQMRSSDYPPGTSGLAICSYMPHVWRSWHGSGTWGYEVPPYPTDNELCSDHSIAPVGNGGLSLRSRSWMRQAIEYCPHANYSGMSDDAVAAAKCRMGGTKSPQEDMYYAAILRGIAHSASLEKNDAKPVLPSAYEASLFAAETKLPHYFEDRFDLGKDVAILERTAERLWGGKEGLDLFRRMRKSFDTNGEGEPVIPNGLHKPWRYLSSDLVNGEYLRRECPHLQRILPDKSRASTSKATSMDPSAEGTSRIKSLVLFLIISATALAVTSLLMVGALLLASSSQKNHAIPLEGTISCTKWAWREGSKRPRAALSLCTAVSLMLLVLLGRSNSNVEKGQPLKQLPKLPPSTGDTVGKGQPQKLLPDKPPPTSRELNCAARLQHRRCQPHITTTNGTVTSASGAGLSGNIIYYDHPRQAGMRDVRSRLYQLGNLAASLCARLVLAPPGRVLRYGLHNRGVELPDDFPYGDYLKMTSRMDGMGDEPMILDGVTMEEAQEYGMSQVSLYLQLNITSGKEAFEQYRQAIEAVDNGKTFVWGIHTNIYQMREEFLSEAAKLWHQEKQLGDGGDGVFFPYPCLNSGKIRGCPYVRIVSSDVQVRAIESFLELAGLPLLSEGSEGEVPYTPFHIRRRDDHPRCNSTLDFLRRYLNCSYAGCPSDKERRKPIVLFTDENDTAYLESVLQVARMYAPKAMHGDEVLREIVTSEKLLGEVGRRRRGVEDNFFLFSVADEIMGKVPWKKRLVRHRSHCNDCDHIC